MERVLCILSSLDAGGAETFIMKIYRALEPDKYQIDFIVSVDGGCYTEEVLERGGKIYKIPKRTEDFYGAFKGIKAAVKDGNYRTVLKLGENALSVTDLIAARLGGAKNLVLRSCNAPTGLSVKEKLIHYSLRPVLNIFAKVKLAPSRLAANFMFGKRAKTKLINNGVDLDLFCFDESARSSIREEFKLENKLVIGHVGRFANQKNHRYLIEIFKEIALKREDAVLLLVGKGELEADIKEQAAKSKLSDRVIFAGMRFDIPQLLSAMDVFVFPSFFEGMPNTVIEAQATGLPCVISSSITKDADITGLVKYISLSQAPDIWADTALKTVNEKRKITKEDFKKHGYDIKTVAVELMDMICK